MTAKTQTQTPQKNQTTPEGVVNTIRSKLRELLELDVRTMAYVYQNEREDRRFEVVEISGDEFMLRIGPALCVEKTEDECYVEVALTVSEALALALKLIKYAATAYKSAIETAP
jgi:hypothetical protein